MNTKNQIVIGTSGANIRTHPSCEKGKIIKFLPYGTEITVISDWTAINTAGGESTIYLPMLFSNDICYISAKLVGKKSTRLEISAASAKNAYETIERIQAKHGSGAKTLDEIVAKKITSCSSSASIPLQDAGCLPVGMLISHTTSDGQYGATKKTIESSIKGYKNLIDGTYQTYSVHRRFKDLPENLKAAGMVYIQDSNICVSAGNGEIFSCNNSGGSYGKGGMPTRRDSGYPFTRDILFVIAPKG